LLPGVESGNDKLRKGVIDNIINEAYKAKERGDERKASNLPTVIE